MATLTIEQVAKVALDSGFTGEAAAIATAIAMGESSGRTDARGDTTITTGTWGPSIGLWQIRSLNADRGTGRQRDEIANLNPSTNGRNAFAISGGGANWRPWTVYTSGRYRAFLAQARMAVGTGGAAIPGGDAATPANSDGGGIGNPFAALFDPGLWLRLGAFIAGGLLFLFGLYRLTGIGEVVVKVAKTAVKARTGVNV